MDIKDKLTQEDKQQIADLTLECQVLANVLKAHDAILKQKVNEILARNGLSPGLYHLKFNPGQDLWEAELKEGGLILPNRETRRAINRN